MKFRVVHVNPGGKTEEIDHNVELIQRTLVFPIMDKIFVLDFAKIVTTAYHVGNSVK